MTVALDFPPKRVAGQSPDLADPWAGPSTYAEDFYSGGDSRSALSAGTNPHLLPAEVAATRVYNVVDEEDYDGLF